LFFLAFITMTQPLLQTTPEQCFPHSGASVSMLFIQNTHYAIRPLAPCDDAQVAALVKHTLAEFGIEGNNCAANDPELAQLSQYRDKTPGCQFYVVTPLEAPTQVLGLGGYEPLKGSDPQHRIVEMAKWYLCPEARGKGIGSKLLTLLLKEVQQLGYHYAYMETTPKLLSQRMFEKAGFTHLQEKWGANGHTHPDITIFMMKPLGSALD
jgi:putative acetyltransferase